MPAADGIHLAWRGNHRGSSVSNAPVAPPMAIDIEQDELIFFPLLYWPVADGQQLPSAKAIERLNRYLATGGTILFDTLIIPYPLSNVANVREMDLRFDYIAVDWPKVQWADEFGVYFDGVLKHYFPPAMAILTNIANG